MGALINTPNKWQVAVHEHVATGPSLYLPGCYLSIILFRLMCLNKPTLQL